MPQSLRAHMTHRPSNSPLPILSFVTCCSSFQSVFRLERTERRMARKTRTTSQQLETTLGWSPGGCSRSGLRNHDERNSCSGVGARLHYGTRGGSHYATTSFSSCSSGTVSVLKDPHAPRCSSWRGICDPSGPQSLGILDCYGNATASFHRGGVRVAVACCSHERADGGTRRRVCGDRGPQTP